jgi:hypothetical protein
MKGKAFSNGLKEKNIYRIEQRKRKKLKGEEPSNEQSKPLNEIPYSNTMREQSHFTFVYRHCQGQT